MKGQVTINRIYYKYQTQSFNASSEFQTFTVPSNISGDLNVDCVASKGANKSSSGGNGGRVQCSFSVTPLSTLYVYVGAIPSSNSTAEYNASDIRTNNDGITNSTSLSSRIVVAGGGGSGCNSSNYAGGAGGGLTGGNGSAQGTGYIAHGGTQTAGGSKPSKGGGNDGTFGLGGNASAANGGAGGAGWYGGGGADGASTLRIGSGGGGSSYTNSSCYSVIHTQGYNDGTGYITITYAVESTESDYDFYRDFYEVKVIKETINNEDKFYGVKEYKRGQYYGN